MNPTKQRFWLKVVNPTSKIVTPTLLVREHKPAGDGWKDVTECLGFCCLQTAQSAVFDFVATPDDTLPQIVLQWNEIVGGTYTIERSTSSDFSTDLTTVYTGTDETHTDEDLEFETTYYYRISATGDGLAQGPYSYASGTTASE